MVVGILHFPETLFIVWHFVRKICKLFNIYFLKVSENLENKIIKDQVKLFRVLTVPRVHRDLKEFKRF